MSKAVSLDQLWESTPPSQTIFQPDQLSEYPASVQHYLQHAIAPGTKLASGVRLQMHGEIKLRQWLPFTAEQVISWHRGFIWQAVVWMNGLPVWGSDRLVDGVGAMEWKLLGLFPVMRDSGMNIMRSNVGRMLGELVWLPSMLCQGDVLWTTPDPVHAHGQITHLGESTTLILSIGNQGELKSIQLKRWGNPEGAEFQYVDFGGFIEAEGQFSGYTIPTRLLGGWYFGNQRFQSEGAFFRGIIDQAEYR